MEDDKKLTKDKIDYWKDRAWKCINRAIELMTEANGYIKYIRKKDRFVIKNNPIKDEPDTKKTIKEKSPNKVENLSNSKQYQAKNTHLARY